MEETIEENKLLSPIAQAIEDLYKENEALKVEIAEMHLYNEKLLTRERCYQSELAKVRTLLQKTAQSIVTTPHTQSPEYAKYYEVQNALL